MFTSTRRRLLLALSLFAIAPIVGAQPSNDFLSAVANDRGPEVAALLAKGVDPNMVDANGEPVLIAATRNNNGTVVAALIAGKANVNARNPFGDTALAIAALKGYLPIAKALVAAGADVNGGAWPPITYAATGGSDEMTTWLLKQGAAINGTSPNHTTALMMAAREGKFSTAVLLIQAGADVNVHNDAGLTALEFAKRSNDKELQAKLAASGAK